MSDRGNRGRKERWKDEEEREEGRNSKDGGGGHTVTVEKGSARAMKIYIQDFFFFSLISLALPVLIAQHFFQP